MPVSFLSATGNVSTLTSSLPVTTPAGLSPGVFRLGVVFFNTTSRDFVTPSGWSRLGGEYAPVSGTGKMSVYYRFYQSGDGTANVNFTSDGGGVIGFAAKIANFAGVHATTPFDVAAPVTAGLSSNSAGWSNVLGITTVTDGAGVYWLAITGDDRTGVVDLAPDAWTVDGPTITSSGDWLIQGAYQIVAPAGPTGARSFTATGAAAPWRGLVVALRPAVPGGPVIPGGAANRFFHTLAG